MSLFQSFCKIAIPLALLAALTACGGGGGNASAPAATTTTTTVVTPVVSALNYQLDKPTITTSSSDRTTLTVTVLDSSNNPIKGITTTVALDNGIYTPVNTLSDANGLTVGVISAGADKSNRTINATIGVKGQTTPVSKAVVGVKGTVITLLVTPATVIAGNPVKLETTIADGAGVGIPGASVALSGTLGFNQTLNADFSGLASASVATGSLNLGSYSVTATGMGASATFNVQVVSGNPTDIPAADFTNFSTASLAAAPNNVSPNEVGSSSNRSTLRAVIQDKNNKGIQNARVRFEIVKPGLGDGEVISSGTSTVYTDSQGVAQAFYIPGTRSSPTNGVAIRACYGATDDEIANNACLTPVQTTLTVATRPLSVSIGDNNELTKGNNNLTYIKKFDIAVADSAGNAVVGAVVSASVDITHYGKGFFVSGGGLTVNNATTLFGYPKLPSQAPNISHVFRSDVAPASTTETAITTTGRVWCQNEDSNRNAFLDADEDTVKTDPLLSGNGNGKLDPRKSDVVLSFVDKNVTDSSGRLAIKVEYAQSVATWLSFTVKATTSVSGSEGTDQRSYIPSFVTGDEINGAFLTPPYGVKMCRDPN